MRFRGQLRAKRVMRASISSPADSTPQTTSVANGSGSRTCSATISAGLWLLVSASYSRLRARSRACRRSETGTSGPAQVLARAGVHADALTRLDEEGDLHDQPGLQRRRLSGAGDPVALDAGLGL